MSDDTVADEAEFDEWADYYDLLYGERDVGDVSFYVEEARRADGPVLELACGTGRVYLELLADGVDADGLDASRKMLDVLEAKAADRGLEPTVWQDDMRSLDADREYGAIFVPFRSFLHLHTIEGQLTALESIHDHLRPGGTLALNVFVPDHSVLAEPTTMEEQIEGPDGETFVMVDRPKTADAITPILEVDRELRDEAGQVVWETTFELKPIYRREFELLVRLAGFSDWTVYGNFDREPLGDAAEEQVWVVEK